MDSYKNKLRAYLDQNPIHYTDGDSLLEELCWCYIEANNFDSSALRLHFQRLHQSLPELSANRFDEVFSVVSELSAEQEKQAFQAGLKTGFRLAAELLE